LNTLQLYAVIPQTQSLGLGTRFAIWVQGCPFRCENCMTPNSLPLDTGQTVDLSQLTQWIIANIKRHDMTLSTPKYNSLYLLKPQKRGINIPSAFMV
jgi:anaerobic ribonucleoside-triphosphate reductase activating protein